MGFYSWKTVSMGVSISNKYSERGALPVGLLIPKEFGGGAIIETDYEGYGVFGGRDVFALLAEWNQLPNLTGNDNNDSMTGINYWFDYKKGKCPEPKYMLKFVELLIFDKTGCKYEDFKGYSEECSKQGFFYEEDNSEDFFDFDDEILDFDDETKSDVDNQSKQKSEESAYCVYLYLSQLWDLYEIEIEQVTKVSKQIALT